MLCVMMMQSLVEDVLQRVAEVYSSCSTRHRDLQDQRRAAAAAVAMETKQQHGRSHSLQSSISVTSSSSDISVCDVQVVSPTIRHSTVSQPPTLS